MIARHYLRGHQIGHVYDQEGNTPYDHLGHVQEVMEWECDTLFNIKHNTLIQHQSRMHVPAQITLHTAFYVISIRHYTERELSSENQLDTKGNVISSQDHKADIAKRRCNHRLTSCPLKQRKGSHHLSK